MHHQFNIQQLYALPTLYLCFVFIWEQTATCATYSINWLVFITEMKSVYSAVRTGSLNKAVCASSVKYSKAFQVLPFTRYKLLKQQISERSSYIYIWFRTNCCYPTNATFVFPWSARLGMPGACCSFLMFYCIHFCLYIPILSYRCC